MFTGLIEEIGSVTDIKHGESSAVITIDSPLLISQIKLGDSVSVNGVCLTATSVEKTAFTADVMVQTLKVTSLSELTAGSKVNLELATTSDGRLGGHIVQGHVDGVAKVVSLTPGEKWAEFIVEVPQSLSKYIVNQGSIAVDGISLTVGNIDDATGALTLWLIPETLERTTLSLKKSQDPVNIEVDILAKYVEKLLKKSGGDE
jgi:riboflavin synthase